MPNTDKTGKIKYTDKAPTAEEFILNENYNQFTKDELNNGWGAVPPSVDEIAGYMKRFTELHIRLGTKAYDID